MTETPESVAKIVGLNGGKLVGKTRLQKSSYFLEELGVGFGFPFEYYFYGPYSEELSEFLDYASALNLIDVKWDRTSAGDKYAIFETKSKFEDEDIDDFRKSILSVLAGYDSVVLELAATADFLEKNGYGTEAWKETCSRKAEKASQNRIVKAKDLLGALRAFNS